MLRIEMDLGGLVCVQEVEIGVSGEIMELGDKVCIDELIHHP